MVVPECAEGLMFKGCQKGSGVSWASKTQRVRAEPIVMGAGGGGGEPK